MIMCDEKIGPGQMMEEEIASDWEKKKRQNDTTKRQRRNLACHSRMWSDF